jgi:hypothetical protein
MTKVWEMALGVIILAASFPLLLISLLVWPYSSIPPQQNLVTIISLVIAALGIGLMHDSNYGSKPRGQLENPSHRRFGFWAVIVTVIVGLMVLWTGVEYLTLSTGASTLASAVVVVVGAIITIVGIFMARRSY